MVVISITQKASFPRIWVLPWEIFLRCWAGQSGYNPRFTGIFQSVCLFACFVFTWVVSERGMRSSRLSKKGTYRLSETCSSDRWGDCGGGGEVLDWFHFISLVWVWPRIWVSCVILSWKWLQYLVILANAISIQEDVFIFARCIYIFFYRVMSYFYNSLLL